MIVPRPVAVILCALPWLAAVAGFGYLFFLRYPPSGEFAVNSGMDGKSPWIFPFLPAERVSSPGPQPDGWSGQRLTADPVYFTTRVPGPYESADVTVEFRPLRQPLADIGVVRNEAGTELELTPLYSSELDSGAWKHVTGGFVRNGTLKSIPAATTAHLAIWDSSTTMPLLADPAADATSTVISLRGSHDFYLIPSGGQLRAKFWFQDANRKSGSDAIVFRVFRGDQEIPEATFALNATNEQHMGALQEHAIVLPHAEPGVYRISFVAQDDVFLRKIETTSKHWVIGPRIYFGDTVGYANAVAPVEAWTNSRHIVAETFHTEGVQTVSFGAQSRSIAKTHELYRMDRADAQAVVELHAPKGDVRIVLDGFAALRPDAFFEPKPRRFTDATLVDAEGIDAVATTYTPPEHMSDGWLRSTFHVALTPNMETLRFVISAPGMASRMGSLDVRRVSLTYHRPAEQLRDWMRTLRQELVNAWHRL